MPFKPEGGKVTSGDKEGGDYRHYTSAVAVFFERWETSTLGIIAQMPNITFESESGIEITVPRDIVKEGEEAVLEWLEEQDDFDDDQFWEAYLPGGESLRYRRGQKR